MSGEILHQIAAEYIASGSPDVVFFCPGCQCGHGVWLTRPNNRGAKWTFNGDFQRPTFSPSLLLDTTKPRCHSYVRDGQIQFLPDCGHALAGKTIPLEPF